eukprot:GGOE01010683.1.p1 GENE.GGOE01010683.1~~GGOE01010683.1.p1  ORF type:complete len:599 (-),score=201.48 GGOE01010683.1:1171-2967(-)
MEGAIKEQFGIETDTPGLLLYPKLLRFILSHVPLFKLLLAVVLMVVAGAGCHHVGMWSIHGMHGSQITSQLNFWSFLTTILLGGTVCVIAILAFLVVPEGAAAVVMAVILTGGIAAFHFSSVFWGMHYIEGEEGVSTNVVIGDEMIIMFVVAQGAISQLITAVFSRMAVQNHATMLKHLQVAQMLGKHIADMDLEPAKAMEMEAENPSVLEQTLFLIVNNLLLYRPYLPDTLFTGHDESTPTKEGEETAREDVLSDESAMSERRGSMASTMTGGACQLSIVSYEDTPTRFVHARNGNRTPSRKASTSPRLHPPRKDRKTSTARTNAGKNLTVGLRSSHLTVLRSRLQGLEFQGGRATNNREVEERLTRFMAVTTAQIKCHGGTIATCASGSVVAFWTSISPDVAIDTAIVIQQQCNLDLIQVVQSAPFLSGNLATEQLRSFNVVGPLDWAGQQLLRAGRGERHIFVTSYEWERVHFKYTCLPYEQVLMDGKPSTLYTVLDTATNGEDREWMYEVGNNLQATPFEEVEKCWQAYARGDYQTAISLAESLNGVPSWYSTHLQAIAFHAAASSVKLPTKCLESLGWPNSMTHQGAILLRDL